jgi:hypothetical protein
VRAVTWTDGVEASEGARGFETTIRNARCNGPSRAALREARHRLLIRRRAQQACLPAGLRVRAGVHGAVRLRLRAREAQQRP